ncbi:hypothetical protein IJD15_05700 [bacterium]|nr:hypothetical protein [bacterium]
MKKILSLFSVLCILFFSAISSAEAVIYSEYDIDVAIQKMNELASQDLLGFINRNELVGYRLDNVNMATMQYQMNVKATADALVNMRNRVDIIRNSADFSDSEKNMQLNQVYQEADASISNTTSKTVMYLNELRRSMPTITYQRYVKKFQEYYNQLNLGNYPVAIK